MQRSEQLCRSWFPHEHAKWVFRHWVKSLSSTVNLFGFETLSDCNPSWPTPGDPFVLQVWSVMPAQFQLMVSFNSLCGWGWFLNLLAVCFHLPSVGIIDLPHHHAWCTWCYRSEHELMHRQAISRAMPLVPLTFYFVSVSAYVCAGMCVYVGTYMEAEGHLAGEDWIQVSRFGASVFTCTEPSCSVMSSPPSPISITFLLLFWSWRLKQGLHNE